MLHESEDFALSVHLGEPEEEGEVVSTVESVPEGADHEDPELGEAATLEGGSLVNAFSEPFLNGYVPMRDLIADVFVGFDDHGAAGVDELELFPVEGNSAGVHRGDTQLPSEVVLESDQGDADD